MNRLKIKTISVSVDTTVLLPNKFPLYTKEPQLLTFIPKPHSRFTPIKHIKKSRVTFTFGCGGEISLPPTF